MVFFPCKGLCQHMPEKQKQNKNNIIELIMTFISSKRPLCEVVKNKYTVYGFTLKAQGFYV